MNVQAWLNEVETLRISKKLNQTFFLKDIVSERQYRRYLTGDSSLTLSIFLKLLERLDYDLPTFLTYLDTKKITSNKPLINYDLQSSILIINTQTI